MSVMRSLGIIGGILLLGIAMPELTGSARTGGEAGKSTVLAQGLDRLPPQPADTAQARAFLDGMRGASPVACGLASQLIEGHWGMRNVSPNLHAVRGGRDAVELSHWVMRGDFDPSIIGPLGAALGDRDPCVRQTAARLLGRVKHPDAGARLIQALGASEAATRTMGALGLGVAEDEASIDPLVSALGDPVAQVRAMAAWALGEIESDAAVPALSRALRDADADVRATAAWALGDIESDSAIDPFVGAMGDTERSVRVNVAFALGEIEDPRAKEHLVRLLQDRDAEVRRAAAWALGNIE